jgi:hypothetical protein
VTGGDDEGKGRPRTLKLRQRDPGGVMYFDRFLAGMAGGKTAVRVQPKGYSLRGEPKMTRPEDLP